MPARAPVQLRKQPFYGVLVELGTGENRLVETDWSEELPPATPLSDGLAFAQLGLRLTRNGERVLEGEADRVELLGIDRWVGGTHVTPENVWRWDPQARTLTR